MSTWRKKETFQMSDSSNNLVSDNPNEKILKNQNQKRIKKKEPQLENFANIPMFDVLKNEKSVVDDSNKDDGVKEGTKEAGKEGTKEAGKEGTKDDVKEGTKDDIKEGFFNFVGDDYFRNSKRNKLFKFQGLNDFFKRLLDFLLSPLTNLDDLFERLLYELLRLLLAFTLEDCNPRLKKTPKDEITKSFVWSNRDSFTNMKEGFALPEKPNELQSLKTTIDELYTIHASQFKSDDAYNKYQKIGNADMSDTSIYSKYNENFMKASLGAYYIKLLGEKGTTYGDALDKYELFAFNNLMDNELDKKAVRDAVFNMNLVLTSPWFNKEIYPLPAVVFKEKPVPAAPAVKPAPGVVDKDACEKQKDGMQGPLKGYSKLIKEQIYMFCLIPISMYVVYNFYYLFFFKDYVGSVKTDDGYKHGDLDIDFDPETCKQEVKKPNDLSGNPIEPPINCTHPIFPDWENIFHYFEKNKADFFLEFIFKPVKLIYSFLNGFKVFFRGKNKLVTQFWEYVGVDVPATNMKDDLPYIFLLATFAMIYLILLNYGSDILGVMFKLLKFDIDNFKMGETNLTQLALSVTSLCLILSLFKKGFGFDLQAIFKFFSIAKPSGAPVGAAADAPAREPQVEASADSEEGLLQDAKKTGINNYKTLSDPKKRTWLVWLFVDTTYEPLILPGNIYSGIVKLIGMIIFWIFKFIVATMMVPVSVYIMIIYFFYNMLFGIYDNADNTNDTSTKTELIDRIIYTKLYDWYDTIDPAVKQYLDSNGSPINFDDNWYQIPPVLDADGNPIRQPLNVDIPIDENGNPLDDFCRIRDNKISYWNYPKVFFKFISWVIIFFMTEIFGLTIIDKGFKSIKQMPGGNGPDEIRFYNALATALSIIYSVLGLLIILWCVYKWIMIRPKHKKYYSMDVFQSADKSQLSKFKCFAFDKTFDCMTEYDKRINIQESLFGILNFKPAYRVFTNGDELNSDYVKEYVNRAPALGRWADKIGKFGSKMKGYLPNFKKMFGPSDKAKHAPPEAQGEGVQGIPAAPGAPGIPGQAQAAQGQMNAAQAQAQEAQAKAKAEANKKLMSVSDTFTKALPPGVSSLANMFGKAKK